MKNAFRELSSPESANELTASSDKASEIIIKLIKLFIQRYRRTIPQEPTRSLRLSEAQTGGVAMKIYRHSSRALPTVKCGARPETISVDEPWHIISKLTVCVR